MERLRLLLIQNHSVLDKLRVRGRYCLGAIKSVETDTHRLYGPFSGFWDDWLIEAEEMHDVLKEHIPSTALFLTELREFIEGLEAKKRLSKSDTSYLKEVTSLTVDKLSEQKALLIELDDRINLHRQITKQLLLVEAIDSLEE